MDEKILIAILSPILVTIGGLITWFLKTKKEEYLTAEEKSREYKIKIYEILLEPFIYATTSTISEKEKEKGISKMLSLEYRKASFNLTTFGSDDVIKSYNRIFQFFFNKPNDISNEEYGIKLLTYYSDLLLNIRKDIYSKNTKLKRSNFLEFMINDISDFKEKIDKQKLK